MTQILRRTLMLIAAVAIVAISGVGGGEIKAQSSIVDLAEKPMDAMSRFPVGDANKGSRFYVVRVLQRKAPAEAESPYNSSQYADVSKKDEFNDLGYLYLDKESSTLMLARMSDLDGNNFGKADNMKYAWQIYTESGSAHKKLQFYSPTAGKYLTHSGGAVSVSDAAPSLWFQVNTYADHMLVQQYNQYGEPEYDKVTEGGHDVLKPVMVQQDEYIYSKHFLYLGNGNNKLRWNGSSFAVVSNTEDGMNDYSSDYLPNATAEKRYVRKDDIVFEIYSAEVATSGQTTYEFHATDTVSHHTWQFELLGGSHYTMTGDDNTFRNNFKETINGVEMSMLRYYKDFAYDGDNIGTSDFPKYKVTCKAAFPFTVSPYVADSEGGNVSAEWQTLSVGKNNEDGCYVGFENNENGSAAVHGHSSDSETYTDFNRHIYRGLFWYFAKSETETDNPNSFRIYNLVNTIHALSADVHNGTGEHDVHYWSWLYEGGGHADCDHDIFIVVPNEATAGDEGFSFVLKSDHTMALNTTQTDFSAKPSGTVLKVGNVGDAKQRSRFYASSANDLINIAANSYNTVNVGGMPQDAAACALYRVSKFPDHSETFWGWTYTHDELSSLENMYLNYMMESYADYKTFESGKQYRIELYTQNPENGSTNKALSSAGAYMNGDGTAIESPAMTKSVSLNSALANGQKAEDAHSYWTVLLQDGVAKAEAGEELKVRFFNPNTGAYLKKTYKDDTLDGVTLTKTADAACDFYIKQEGTSDQWVILNTVSTDKDNVKKLSVVRGNEVYSNPEHPELASPDAFINAEIRKVDNTLYWSSKYNHGQDIALYEYNTEHAAHHGRWMFTPIESYPLTLSSVGCSSLCLPYPVSISGASVYKAKECRVETEQEKLNKGIISSITLEEISGSPVKLPANTPVVLKGTAGADVSITVLNETVEAIGGNRFVAVNAQWGDKNSADEMVAGRAYFGLGNRANTGVGFYPILASSGNTYLPANKAYLNSSFADPGNKLPQVSAAKGAGAVLFRFVDYNGTVTEINSVTGETSVRPADGVYYDLSGRRVATPGKGIYVNSNGKKFIVK